MKPMLDLAIKAWSQVVSKCTEFMWKLESIINDRDSTPDKLKNAGSMPKFSGYDCEIDFYTFKSKFKKLVEPTVQKKHWPDYLKQNYLCGMAFTLVGKETNYEKIWERLADSFGKVK